MDDCGKGHGYLDRLRAVHFYTLELAPRGTCRQRCRGQLIRFSALVLRDGTPHRPEQRLLCCSPKCYCQGRTVILTCALARLEGWATGCHPSRLAVGSHLRMGNRHAAPTSNTSPS